MKYLAVIDESKDFLTKFAYNIIYGRKFKKLYRVTIHMRQ